MMEISRVDQPPKAQHPKYDWPKIVKDALAANGGWLWVRVPQGFSTSTIGAIQDGRNNYIDPEVFEVKSGETFTNEDGNRRANMYIRVRPEVVTREKEETK